MRVPARLSQSSTGIGWERDVASGLDIDLGHLEPVEMVPGCAIDLPAARNEDRIRAWTRASSMASSTDGTARTPSPRHILSRVTTNVVRPGSGRPIES